MYKFVNKIFYQIGNFHSCSIVLQLRCLARAFTSLAEELLSAILSLPDKYFGGYVCDLVLAVKLSSAVILPPQHLLPNRRLKGQAVNSLCGISCRFSLARNLLKQRLHWLSIRACHSFLYLCSRTLYYFKQ
jgi:hypothetical protein